jgi:DNA polymerase-3 subunit epsilon
METRENRIVAVDVETPNGRDAAICQIGIVVAEYGEIVKTESHLIDPEVPFDPVNISIHGITPADVLGAPNFAQLWPRIAAYFEDSVVVAHNAAFDLGMITATLERYGIPVPEITYCCTVQMGRKVLPGISHKLNVLCEHYGIALDHHKADSDSRACAEILLRYFESGAQEREHIRTFRLV